MNTYISDNLTALYAGGWSTAAIKLGSAVMTGAQNNIGTSIVDVTGLTSTVTVPSGGRSVKVTAKINFVTNGANNSWNLVIHEDGVEIASTIVWQAVNLVGAGSAGQSLICIATKTPTAGSHTYKARFTSNVDGNITYSATDKGFILVELV